MATPFLHGYLLQTYSFEHFRDITCSLPLFVALCAEGLLHLRFSGASSLVTGLPSAVTPLPPHRRFRGRRARALLRHGRRAAPHFFWMNTYQLQFAIYLLHTPLPLGQERRRCGDTWPAHYT